MRPPTANEGAIEPGAQSSVESWIAQGAFVALLLLVYVGLTPFTVTDPAVTMFGKVGSSGDSARQFFYLAVFAVIVASAARKHGFAAFASVPILLALLLAWCLASAAWAAEPTVTLRRAGLAIVVVLSVMLSVDTIGMERVLKLWRVVLALVLVANWISIPLIHAAVHLPGEADPGLVGDWRGMFGHKNIAGSVCALTAILFLFPAIEARKAVDMLVCAAALGFLIMTKSKSSLGLLPIALAAGAVYRLAWRRELDRTIVVVAGALVLVVAVTFAVADSDAIARALEDPNEFTGRSAIWAAEIAYIRDHPFLGAGFGTFADTGGLSPLHLYVSSKWVEGVSHGHSGYLQLLVTIGGIGFALALLALIVTPLFGFWRLGPMPLARKSLLFAIFVFFMLHNFMESDFLEGDAVTWVAFLLMLAMLRSERLAPPAEQIPDAYLPWRPA